MASRLPLTTALAVRAAPLRELGAARTREAVNNHITGARPLVAAHDARRRGHTGGAVTGGPPTTIDEGGKPATGAGGAVGFGFQASWQGSDVNPTAPTPSGASRSPV